MSPVQVRWGRVGSIVLFFLGFALSLNAFTYFNFDGDYGFLRLKKQAIETGLYLPAFYSHVLVAGVVLIIGFFQFSNRLRIKLPALHRGMGKMYVAGILFFSAPGGLVMSFFINRGPFVLTSFIVQCALWFWCTYMAFNRIKNGDVTAHRQWMIRSFSLTLAAITLRVYVFLSSWSVDLSHPAAYATIAWLSWLPNLLLAEFYIRQENRNLRKTA